MDGEGRGTSTELTMETPRPTLDVTNLDSPESLRKKRKTMLKDAMGKPHRDAGRVVTKYRSRQTKLLGERDEDPHPYSPTYVFYCLDSPPKE